jgi:ABC-type phosphate/phosphonate transport system substrate-binding protein
MQSGEIAMGLFRIISVVMFSAMIILFTMSAAGPKPENNSYTFGFKLKYASEMDAQNRSIFGDMVKAIAENYKMTINQIWYEDDEEFVRAVKKGELDFAFTNRFSILTQAIETRKYRPFIAPNMLGRKSIKFCLYANPIANVGSIESAKGKRALIVDDSIGFYSMRMMLGENPGSYFSSLKIGPSSISIIYALAMSDADVGFVDDITIEFMKKNNPGPVKKLMKIACSDDYFLQPLLVLKDVPKESVSKIEMFLLGDFAKNELLKKYRPLLKMYKFGFIKVSEDDYSNVLYLYRKAQKSLWEKEYDYWLRYAEQKD